MVLVDLIPLHIHNISCLGKCNGEFDDIFHVMLNSSFFFNIVEAYLFSVPTYTRHYRCNL